MSRARSTTQNAQAKPLDSSHSRTLLTRQNYRGPRLLRTIKGQPDPLDSLDSEPVAATIGMAKLQDQDIYAPPISSDEEEETPAKDKSHSSIPGSDKKRKADRTEESSAVNKRAKKEAKPTRASNRTSQKLKFGAEPELVAELAPQSSGDVLEFPDFLSQSSQQKKQQRKFGKASNYNRRNSQDGKFADPGGIPSTSPKSQSRSFNAPEGPPGSLKRTPGKKIKNMELPSSARESRASAAAFKVPEEMGHPLPSSTTTEVSNVFDVEDSPKATHRKRRSSTSSLSSVDSMASYELSQEQKDELANAGLPQKPVPPDCIRCPLCHRIVDLKAYPSLSDPTDLPLRKQQTFCQTHLLDDVNAEWQENGYPIIDWKLLEKRRIPRYIPHLRQVLYRKSPSFYLDHLESKLAEAKGNQSKIRRYLANEIVEVVKPGYYGPRGAKVMGNQVTTEMSHHLKRSLKADDTVRAVGISGFVSAVLLPELLQQLVMQDMKSDETEARKVISASTEAGMLLWPDDDHVVADAGGDDVERG